MFRDGHSPHIVKEEQTTMYPALANYASCNGPEGAVSPSAAAAAVAAVAQGNYICPLVHPLWFADTIPVNSNFSLHIRAYTVERILLISFLDFFSKMYLLFDSM